MKYVMTRAMVLLWRYTRCIFGDHAGKNTDANFCVACGHMLRPDAYNKYQVTMSDGSKRIVDAINEKHAVSIVKFGTTDLEVDRYTGRPLNKVKVKAQCIHSVIKKS